MNIQGIDDIDRTIIKLLVDDARLSYSEIGKKVGLSRVAVKNRIKAIEDEGIIKGIGSFECSDDCLDAKGKRVIPGLIDTHIHAFGGYDLKNGGLNEISKILAAEGTTCWLPTTFTDSIENLV